MELHKISTEKRNHKTKNIDILSTKQICQLINEEDKTIAFAVEKVIDRIAEVVDLVTKTFQNGGRLIYIGAGTSGRLGVLDASECPPTFGVDHNMVVGLIAGGDHALRFAVEDVEDSLEVAKEDLKNIDLTKDDFVIGIAASGRTPYVIGGLSYAREVGCLTGCITTSENSKVASISHYPIEVITGAEPLTGSTRMKSGTAQKMVLNMITTTSMVKIGKVYENLMIDVQMNNQKLVSRAQTIVMDVTGVNLDIAQKYLEKYGSVKFAIFAILSKIDDLHEIKHILDQHDGNIRESLKNNIK